MKKILFLAAAFFTGAVAMAQQSIDQTMKLNADKHDFGKIARGVPVTTVFTLTNISDKPIVIESAQPSCGCTTPEYAREPIPAGGSTKIKVGYNAAAMGRFDKPVTIKLAGINETKQIIISGEVVEGATAEAVVAKEKTVVAAPAGATVQTKTKTKTKVKKASK